MIPCIAADCASEQLRRQEQRDEREFNCLGRVPQGRAFSHEHPGDDGHGRQACEPEVAEAVQGEQRVRGALQLPEHPRDVQVDGRGGVREDDDGIIARPHRFTGMTWPPERSPMTLTSCLSAGRTILVLSFSAVSTVSRRRRSWAFPTKYLFADSFTSLMASASPWASRIVASLTPPACLMAASRSPSASISLASA